MEPLGVAETVSRLHAHLAALRAQVLATAQRIPHTPRADVKNLLADHLHDDALAADALQRRIAELGGAPDAGGHDSGANLLAELRSTIARLDPFADEPTLRLLTRIVAEQERHAADGAGGPLGTAPDDPETAAKLQQADAAAAQVATAPADEHARLARHAWDLTRHAMAIERAALLGVEPPREHLAADERWHARDRPQDL